MKLIKQLLVAGLFVAAASSCKKELFEVDYNLDPNAPPSDLYLNNATAQQINALGVGLQSVMRAGFVDFTRNAAAVGREVIFSASTDNRYFTELLGTNTAALGGANDPTGIFNGYYSSYSQTRRRAEQFITAAKNTNSITAAQKSSVEGFAKTVQAFVTLNLALMQGKNGIRETFSDYLTPGDLLKPGKFGTYATALALCKKYADDGLTALNAAGTTFPFTINSGFAGFSSVADFRKFNRAIAARIAMHQADWAGVLSALNGSFLDLTGNLGVGPRLIFSTAPNDFTNGLFHVANSSGAPYVVFNDVIADAEAGDRRMFGAGAKVGQRLDANGVPNPRQSGAFTSTHEVRMYASNVASASIIRNEELVLMYAEAQAQLNATGLAKTAIDLVRANAGLPAYSGALTTAALVDEVLKQRRYSLFNEGHRWFDMRRYNRLASVRPSGLIGTITFVVFEAMARPDAEVQWDLLNP
ncbi:MAG: RagB/SusD family nutrient uptake outer membrane protein [Bacteroidetes bacterium]|nr:MAG: RagB/SusD family nutrient uptake outer membrane protein [Bacteroidota bacterium]